ncbi:hypothetical protein IHC93_19100 [Photobacterium damselae subsp. damselae]|nr:hypothetical protein [Photobacterium damselae]UKA27034.1 hypothetical protein IHC93_19100 [Photobacterium damselae subsp. damselae]
MAGDIFVVLSDIHVKSNDFDNISERLLVLKKQLFFIKSEEKKYSSIGFR